MKKIIKMSTIITLALIVFLACYIATAKDKLDSQTSGSVVRTQAATQGDSNILNNASAAIDSIVFNPNLTYGEVADVDGNVYKTITIGTQTWMAENLKTTKLNDTTAIPNITGATAWSALTSPGMCTFNNTTNADTINTYGRLYNWYTINTGQLAPAGWHVPTDAEWTILENYLIANGFNYDGATIGSKYAKALASASGWASYTGVDGAVGNTDFPAKRNATGFTALPGGERYFNGGKFYSIGYLGNWWTSSEQNTYYAQIRFISYNMNFDFRSSFYKRSGYSVRCVKDTSSVTGIIPIYNTENQNMYLYPNPFTSITTIKYKVTEPGLVTIKVFDAMGIEVATLVNEKKPLGEYTIDWNASGFGSGFYFCKLHNGNRSEAKKMLLMK